MFFMFAAVVGPLENDNDTAQEIYTDSEGRWDVVVVVVVVLVVAVKSK